VHLIRFVLKLIVHDSSRRLTDEQFTNMSVMEYDLPRRYPSHHDLSYPNYYFETRSAPLALSHHARIDPRGYSMGGPVGGARGQLGMERDEPTYDLGGHSRRRIAVAVSIVSLSILQWVCFVRH
jgi:hypothetical protein